MIERHARVEREKADHTLEDGGSAIDETADAVISRARSRADEVLAAARARTDRASAPGTPIPVTHARRIQRAGARMNRLVGDLVDVASIEAGVL